MLSTTVGSRVMRMYALIYLPLLKAACTVTLGYVLWFMFNGGGIDPGPPNSDSRV